MDRHLLHEVTVVERLPDATIARLGEPTERAGDERWLNPLTPMKGQAGWPAAHPRASTPPRPTKLIPQALPRPKSKL